MPNSHKSFHQIETFFFLQTQTNLFIKLTQIFLSNSHKSCCQIHTHFQFIKNVFPYYVLNKAATAFHQTFTFLSQSHKYIFHIQPIFFILTQIFVIKLKQIFFVKQKQISKCSCQATCNIIMACTSSILIEHFYILEFYCFQF